MIKNHRIFKLASLFSKAAIWQSYITKWAAKDTKYLGMLKTFADKVNDQDLKSKLLELHKLYSNFIFNMNPAGATHVDKVPDNITQQADNIIRSIMTHPVLNLKTGLKGEEYLAQNLDKLFDLLPDISLDISNTIDEIAEGKEPEPLNYEELKRLNEEILQTAPEDEEDELKKFISEEFGKTEFGSEEDMSPEITYIGEGFSISGPSKTKSESDKMLERVQRKQKAKAIQEARRKSEESRTPYDNKLIAQYERMIATQKAAYRALKADPEKWAKFIESKREASLRAYHASSPEEKEAKKARMREYSRLIADPLKRIIKQYIADNANSNPIIKAFIDKKVEFALKTKEKAWTSNQEKLQAKEELDAQEKKLIRHLKSNDPFILKAEQTLRAKYPHISKYEK
jgi:hypothetical protein